MYNTRGIIKKNIATSSKLTYVYLVILVQYRACLCVSNQTTEEHGYLHNNKGERVDPFFKIIRVKDFKITRLKEQTEC